MTQSSLMKQNLFFLLFTFAITYGFWLILVFCKTIESGSPLFLTLHILGGAGPTLAPFIVLAIFNKNGFREYIRRIFKFKFSPLWYLLCFVLVASTCFLLYLFHPNGNYAFMPWYMFFAFIPMMILGGGLEELGWRGFFLDNLLKENRSKLLSALIIGIIWALWHLPLFYITGTYQYGNDFFLFAIGVVGLSCMLTVLYSLSRSTFLALLFHTLINTSYAMGFSPNKTDLVGAQIQSVVLLSLGLLAIGSYVLIDKIHSRANNGR
jgi:uncharacterized protein